MTTYFTSDEHYDHFNIIQYCKRPFTDVLHMQRELIARHNTVVTPTDHVYHLGDFSLNEKTIPLILPQLNGIHHLISGNHDRCHPCHKKHAAAKQRYLHLGFNSVSHEVHMGSLLLNHLPYTGDSTYNARYPEYRPKDEGKWLLHGHVHDAWKTRPRMVNVGVDQWDFTPVSLVTLLALIEGA